MRQVQIDRFGGPEELYVADQPDLKPGPDQVLLRVEAAGVNPIDYKIRDGSSGVAKKITPEMFPLVLGRECCGVVESVGEGADLTIGQRVFGMVSATSAGGCYAETVVLEAAHLASAPEGVSSLELAGVPVASSAAWTAVHTLGKVRAGEKVLVHGAGGGVGQTMLQLAVQAGAEVWGSASAGNAERIRELGATPVDYRTEDFREVVPKLDLVLDGVYFTTFEPSLDHLTEDGRVVVLPTLADLSPAKERGIEAHIVTITPDREVLTQIGRGLASGDLSIEVSQTFELEQIAEAHRLLEDGHTRGKVVLDLR